MYQKVDIQSLPSKGIYYRDDVYINIRPWNDFEIESLKNFKCTSFAQEIKKLEYSILSIDTNIDELDICFSDIYHLYYLIYGLTYGEILTNFNESDFLFPIIQENFLYTNPEFSKKEDLFFEELNIKFYLPSIYNISKANLNVINHPESSKIISNKPMIERMALVPYLQQEKISDNALNIINEHLMSFSDEQINKMRNFLNTKENVIVGQRHNIIYNGEEHEILITLSQLIC